MPRAGLEGQDVKDVGGEEGDESGREPFLGEHQGDVPEKENASPATTSVL